MIIPDTITVIGEGAFSGIDIEQITITNPHTVIEAFAFTNCANLTHVFLPEQNNIVIKKRAFSYTTALVEISNLDQVLTVEEYAFANSGIKEVTIGSNATYGEGAFYQSSVVKVTIGKNSIFGLGAFQNCQYLTTVVMPEEGNVHFGVACFANDSKLAEIDLSKIDNVIEKETFYGCSSLSKANLEHVEEIGNYAFSDCASLVYLHMPKVIKIGEGAFQDMMKMEVLLKSLI